MSKEHLNKWFQDGPPSSYKIQVLYVDIPKHLQLNKKAIDTPFRFRNFEEAEKIASEMFGEYETKITASNDEPHWQVPESQMTKKELKDQSWYDVYGVTPSYQVDYKRRKVNQMKDDAEKDSTYQDLKSIKPVKEK